MDFEYYVEFPDGKRIEFFSYPDWAIENACRIAALNGYSDFWIIYNSDGKQIAKCECRS